MSSGILAGFPVVDVRATLYHGSYRDADLFLKAFRVSKGLGFNQEIPLCPRAQGLEEMMSSGILAGFPVVDVRATLYHGSYRDADLFLKAFRVSKGLGFNQELPLCPRAQGLEEMMSSGILAGFPVVDVRATLYDGSYHDVDSSVLAFQIAARAAFREGMKKGNARLLEPIMKVGCSQAILYNLRTFLGEPL